MRVSARPLRSVLAAALALAAVPALAQSPYSKTVFFGDSLTDTGYYRPILVQLNPSASILGRFTTNPGWVWSEYVAEHYGTDATPNGVAYPQQLYGDALYQIYFRFLETEDEYFDYAPAAVPPQGRWRIYGIGLPDQILRKVYNANAMRILGLKS